MPLSIAVVMDSIADCNIKKDSTLAILEAAQARGWEVYYLTQQDLYLENSDVLANAKRLRLDLSQPNWYELDAEELHSLSFFDVVLMRKDPPFNMEYIYTTYLLELAQAQGCLIVNNPQALRDANEKMFTAWFPQCCPPSLVARESRMIKAFLQEHKELVLKPLDAMGGHAIFRLSEGNENTNVIIETLTENFSRYVMAQKYIPEITSGDKRIILIDGKPVPHAIARIPAKGEFRGNLAVGASAVQVEFTERDQRICDQIGPTLKDKGLLFVGIDIIGDYLTEINVTSPTCIRELDTAYGIRIAEQIIDAIAAKL